tara:strand:- start:984 stop:1601 length:618 start_codon:yes stop_codon:yes gene_type:complete
MNIEVKNSVKPVDYIESMKILEKRVEDVSLGKKSEFLWILEHKTVYTAGTSSKIDDLINKKLKVIKTNRGGKHTLHSPGQKVIYFVLNLNKREKDIRKLVGKIEKCVIEILNEYKIKSYADKKNIGIWVKNKKKIMKIAAIGIRVRKWIAYHGFAINISNDLSKYKNIIPCGIKDKGVTSLKEMGINNFSKIEKIITQKFLNTFP